MPLTFTVLRCPDSIPPETRTVQGGEFTVGRGPGVDWVLTDPERLLSKHHFAVAYRGGSWQIADTSTNGTTLNRDPAPIGQSELRVLRDGDRLTLGSYEIEVRLTEEAVARERIDASIGGTGARFGGRPRARAASPFADPFALDPLAPPPPARPPFDEPAQPGFGLPTTAQLPSDFDPLAPEPGEQSFLGPTRSDHSPALQDAFRPPPTTGQMPLHTGGRLPGDDLLPDDWDKDLLEGINPQPVPPTPPPPPPPAEPPAVQPVSQPQAQPAVRSAEQQFKEQDDQDPFAEPAPAANHVSAPFDAPFDPQPAPPVPTQPAPSAPAATPLPSAPTPAPESALLSAFLQGAGLTDVQPADPTATMHVLGQAFRAMVSGLRAVLIARASIKSEFRIEQTIIRARGNNPLKFSAGDDDALAALLGTGRRTDMTAAAAVTDALKDIRLHELASLAAMQSAVRAVLDGLDPAKLRAQANQGGAMSVLPAQKKARAWDAYEALHMQTVQALSDDFDSVFGKAFARAYEHALDEVAAREQ
jgi:type VI secretion system FHA domain protein